MRLIKVLLGGFVALFCLFYALQNIANLQAGYGFVAYVASMADHVPYPDHFGPPVTMPALIWAMFFIIVALEILAGLLAAKGTWHLFNARNASAKEFQAAKKFVLLGCGVAVIVWFGLFGAISGGYFQAWQTEAGLNALRDAGTYSIQIGIVLLIIAMKDD